MEPAASLAQLSAALWDERDALEQVLFRVAEVRLIASERMSSWLAKADDDLRDALRELDACTDARAAAVVEFARTLGLAPSCPLLDVVVTAPAPWSSMLAEHRHALRQLARDVDAALAAVRPAVREAGRARLDRLLDDETASERDLLVAAATHRLVLRTTACELRPALAEFLS